MNVVVLTTIWRRPSLTSFVLSYFDRIKRELEVEGIRLYLYAAGSEGEASHKLVADAGFHYVEAPNEPLYEKWLACCELARTHDRFANGDVFLVLGSDNLVNKGFIRLACSMIKSGTLYGQPTGCVFVDLETGRSSFLQGFQGGAGRIVSRELVKRADWKLWRENPQYSIDHWQHKRMESLLDRTKLEGRMISVPIQMAAPWQLIDIKGGGVLEPESGTTMNVWPWSDFSPEKNPLCTEVKTDRYLADYFPEVLELLPTDEKSTPPTGAGG